MSTTSLWRKLARSKKYREAFVASHLKRAVPFQITAMRKKAGFSQEQLAEAAGLTQGVISRAENPNYGNLTLNTVLHIAAGLDVAFVGEFVSFSDLVRRVEQLSEQSAQVATFKEEQKAIQEREQNVPLLERDPDLKKFYDEHRKLERMLMQHKHGEAYRKHVVLGMRTTAVGKAAGAIDAITQALIPVGPMGVVEIVRKAPPQPTIPCVPTEITPGIVMPRRGDVNRLTGSGETLVHQQEFRPEILDSLVPLAQ